ncbi:MAG: DegT/DnrJ/EryC1/StrS family aminotransferase [Candidatus Dormibacteria bacterium]
MADIPFLDLAAPHAELAGEMEAALLRVVRRGWYVLGDEVEAFEREFALSVGAAHCVGVASGLDALELALVATGVGPRDEVLVPSNTYIATWLAVSNIGAVPVPVEPVTATMNIDPALVEARLTPRTKAILPVHLYGLPADLDPLRELARAHGLALVDDAAQAHGARYHGRPIGALADATAWSFYPSKNLGAYGDGGAVTTDNPELAAAIRLRRNYGASSKYVNPVRGRNSRLDEVQAAVLRVKLPHLEAWNQRRRSVARGYIDWIADDELTMPLEPEGLASSWHLFPVRTSRRDELAAWLKQEGIATLVHYPVPPHLQGAYAEMNDRSYPISERIHETVLSLPIGPHMTDAQARAVIEAVNAF